MKPNPYTAKTDGPVRSSDAVRMRRIPSERHLACNPKRPGDAYRRLPLTPIARMRFQSGEVYLFSPAHRPADASSCLWGVVDASIRGRLKMEILSYGFSEYRLDCLLPEGFRYARLATRDELRDFVYNIAYREGTRHPRYALKVVAGDAPETIFQPRDWK